MVDASGDDADNDNDSTTTAFRWRWSKRFTAPVYHISSADLTGDTLPDLVVMTMHSLDILQVCAVHVPVLFMSVLLLTVVCMG